MVWKIVLSLAMMSSNWLHAMESKTALVKMPVELRLADMDNSKTVQFGHGILRGSSPLLVIDVKKIAEQANDAVDIVEVKVPNDGHPPYLFSCEVVNTLLDSFTRLTQLNLDGVQFTYSAMENLLKRLKEQSAITSLSLRNTAFNKFTVQRGALDLGDVPQDAMTDVDPGEVFATVMAALEHPQNILVKHLDETVNKELWDMDFLCNLVQDRPLQYLNLADNGLVSADVYKLLAALNENTSLTVLNLDGNYIDDEGQRSIADFLSTRSGLQISSARQKSPDDREDEEWFLF